MTKFFAVNLGVLALLAVSGLVSLVASTGELADPTGALSVTLPAGSSSSPSYRVASIGLKGEAVFRGQVKQSTGNVITFHRVPDLLDPSKSSAPFRQGMLATQKARATAASDGNKSVSLVTLTSSGSGYLSAPKVYVDLPTEGNDSSVDFELAFVSSEINANTGLVTGLSVEDRAKGTRLPEDQDRGGIHFLRCAWRAVRSTKESFILSKPIPQTRLLWPTHWETTFPKSLRMILWLKSSKLGRSALCSDTSPLFKRWKFIGCRLRLLAQASKSARWKHFRLQALFS